MRKKLIHRAETAILLLMQLALPYLASADGINGYLEYGYSTSRSNSSDVSGSTTSSKSSNLSQRYNLELDKSFTPTIRMSMGANVQMSNNDSDTDGLKSHATSSRISPHVDLGYSNGFFSGGAGFSRRIEDSRSGGVSSPTTYADSYSGRLNWMPEDFPNLNLIYSSFDNYDEQRLSRDTNTTSLTFSSRYKPVKNLDLSYSGNHSTTTNRLSGFETESLTQSTRVDYNDFLFRDRLAVSSSYNIATQKTVATNNGSSNQLLLNPVSIDSYYYATPRFNDPITPAPNFTANPLQALPNNIEISNAQVTSVSNHVSLGVKIGFNQAVNIIRLLVTPTIPRDLVAADYDQIGNAFAANIKVYTSLNGSDWLQWAGTTSIIFKQVEIVNPSTGATTTGPAFELALQNSAKTVYNYIRIEIVPVVANNIQLPNGLEKLLVTKLETYLQDQNIVIKPGSSRTSSQIAGSYNLNIRARLWDVPTVTFDSGFDLNHTKSDSSRFAYRYALTNGLSLYHIFSPTLSSSGRISRQDDINPTDNTSNSSNSLSLSLAATPLPTLSGTVNYSARQDESDTTSKTSQSLNLSSSAELYRGINLSLNVGGALTSDNSGKEQQSLNSSLGVNLLPHRSMSINIGASDQESWASGGDTRPDNKVSYNRSVDVTVSYTPLQTVYLFGAFNIVVQSHQKTQTAQSVGGSWSPFRDGALQLNISYREAIQADSTKDRTFTNSAHLIIRPGMFLDLSFLMASSDGVTQKSDVQSLSGSFRASF